MDQPRALDRVYAQAATGPGPAAMSTPDWKATRWALRTGENKLTEDKRGPGQPDRAHQPPHRPGLDAQRTAARRLPRRSSARWRPPVSSPLDHRGQTQPHQRLRRPGQTARGLLRGSHRSDRTGHHQRPHRRHQRQDPTHQRPRLRPPLRPNAELNDLPLPRRTTPQTPHNNLRSRTSGEVNRDARPGLAATNRRISTGYPATMTTRSSSLTSMTSGR